MILPSSLSVGKRLYTVHITSTLRTPWRVGLVQYEPNQRIHLAKQCNVTKRKRSTKEINRTFWHEVTHAVLYDMDHSLYKNEAFVDAFATRLSDAIDSARFS